MRCTRHFFLFLVLCSGVETLAQGLYTARGYWEESTKKNYVDIKRKQIVGDSLTTNERSYIKDYETYLASYYEKLPIEEKQKYEQMKEQWDRIAAMNVNTAEVKEFEWRGRDRAANALYGIWYGGTIVNLLEIESTAAGGIPLITAGLWMLGPAINPQKYEGITRTTVRAGNTGKLLGLGYGAALGYAVAGNQQNSSKWAFGLSSLGSIALGEAAFQLEKEKKFSRGRVEMIRHYGFLGPWIGFSLMASSRSESPNLAGGAVLAGGIAGLLIGNQVAKKYDYTRGDVDAISSLTLITTGVGFAFVTESVKNAGDLNSLFLVPAAGSIIGTLWGQRAVRGLHLTDKQGSTINLSTAGAALIGVGIVTIAKSSSSAVSIGVPVGLALITHQMLLHTYKMKNLQLNFRGSMHRKNNYSVSLKITPENYFLNKSIPVKDYSPQNYSRMQNPLFNLTLTF